LDKEKSIARAKEHFGKLLCEQWDRVERIKESPGTRDFSKLPVIKIGVCGGDGIGPMITKAAADLLAYMLKDEKSRIQFIDIEGLTIENRIAQNKAIPDDVLAELTPGGGRHAQPGKRQRRNA
jgi:isocitrate dehydrogenase (NAD+)